MITHHNTQFLSLLQLRRPSEATFATLPSEEMIENIKKEQARLNLDNPSEFIKMLRRNRLSMGGSI